MTRPRRNQPVICTDDSWLLSVSETPVTVDDLREKMVAPHVGTPAALWWSIGDREAYNYETQIGEIAGEGYEASDLPDWLRRSSQNTRHLIATSGGPLTALVNLCHDAGMEFFSRVRMNSHYRLEPSSPDYGRFRREHPELLIGRPGEEFPKGSMEWAVRGGLDYTFPQVREHIAKIIIEQFERFDVDGVEMDFMRHPTFFRPEEAYANRYLMTDLVRHVRSRMRKVTSATGRDIHLAVRVPPTLSNSARVGLDVEQWIDERLVDIVVAGMGKIPFETPIREFVDASDGTDIQVYGCIEASRPAVDESVIRALASRYWSAGASGIYMYNFYTMSGEWKQRVLNQIADPAILSRLDKRYELDHVIMPEPISEREAARNLMMIPKDRYVQIRSVFRYAIPAPQLPVIMEETLSTRGAVLKLEIADDVETASADGALGICDLLLVLDNFTPGTEIQVHLNQEIVPWDSGKVSEGWRRLQPEPGYFTHFPQSPVEETEPGAGIRFEVDCPPLKQGENELEIRLLKNGSRQTAPAVLKGVEVNIHYKESPSTQSP